MDLGIKGKIALVCAASKGLGKGCAMSVAREGVDLVITARGKDALEATSAEIRKATGPSSNKTLTVLKKGDMFGEMAIIDKMPRSASAVAVKPWARAAWMASVPMLTK